MESNPRGKIKEISEEKRGDTDKFGVALVRNK